VTAEPGAAVRGAHLFGSDPKQILASDGRGISAGAIIVTPHAPGKAAGDIAPLYSSSLLWPSAAGAAAAQGRVKQLTGG
jgi:hypothetical protein